MLTNQLYEGMSSLTYLFQVSDNMSDSLDGNRFVNPEPVINGKLSNSQINQWRKSGYCLVDGLLDADEIEDVLETSRQVLSERDSNLKATFGSAGYLEFPTTYKPVNNMTLNERIITSCEQLLGSTDLLLTQADIWKKRGTEKTGPEDHADQRIHMDYVNNTLLHPPCWDEPEAVSIIIYYSDADECGGRTAVLPKKSCDDPNYKWPYVHMPGMVGTDWANDKSCAEKIIRDFDPNVADFRNQLYQQEKYVNYNKGTILFYRLDVWHRGTPISPNKERFVQNLVFKKKDSSWLNQWNQGTARHMYLPGQIVENMIAKCSLKQRQVLGFPPPGHPHWTNDMINAVEARYSPHGMDVAPYRDALVDLNTTS